VIGALSRLRSTEITAYLQYKQHAYMVVSLLTLGLKKEFEAHAEQELQHADMLAACIASDHLPVAATLRIIEKQ
jgi:bacterioferritin